MDFLNKDSVLSIDPGLVNFGWCIYCVRDGTLESVLHYGVMHACNVSPTNQDIDQALDKIKKELILPYRPIYNSVCFESQPYISHASDTARVNNFRMQQLEMGLRGLLKGLGIPYTGIDPKSVKAYWKIGTGNYHTNKKVVVDFARELGFVFKELPYDKQHHVCDCFAQARYLLSKTGVLKLSGDDDRQRKQPYRAFGERRKKHSPHPVSLSPPSPEEGGGTSKSQDNSPCDQ